MYTEDLALNNLEGLYAIKPNQPNPNINILIYMYKEDLALNNLQGLVFHKTQPNEIYISKYICMKRIWH